MNIHILRYSYYYKNAPNDIIDAVMIAPKATSSEARLYFWYTICMNPDIQWAELDCIWITQVRSEYIKNAIV